MHGLIIKDAGFIIIKKVFTNHEATEVIEKNSVYQILVYNKSLTLFDDSSKIKKFY